ncbi:MAG: cytochrome c oxidase assembly protein [Dermatophilaceae bacterium]
MLGHSIHGEPVLLDAAAVVLAPALIAGYAWASTRSGRAWPRHRLGCWAVGVVVVVVAATGPPAHRSEMDFRSHVAVHLLLGMAGPLLLVAARPVTVLLRALRPRAGRAVTAVLRSPPVRVLTSPSVAAVLDVGGLWVLHTTGLYAATREHPVLHGLVHAHMLVAGCLFTAAILQVDPTPHPRSHVHRAAVLVSAMAAHAVLAKHLWASPPPGVGTAEAQAGALTMYYGGDLVHVLLLVTLGASWYRSEQRRRHRVAPMATGRTAENG